MARNPEMFTRRPARGAGRAGRPLHAHERIAEHRDQDATDARQPAHGAQLHPAVAELLSRHGQSGMFGREAPRGSSGRVGGRR